jgi:hypothetical protein
MGKKIINRERKVREEGDYSNPHTLLRYQQRPDRACKLYRDLFRLSMDFQNKFLHILVL